MSRPEPALAGRTRGAPTPANLGKGADTLTLCRHCRRQYRHAR
jgi:hypothetical protein